MSSTPSGALARAKTPNGGTKESPSKRDGHELQDLDSKPLLPIEEDMMQLARLGEIGAIQKLFDCGKFDASYADEQGITPLHVRIHSEWELKTGAGKLSMKPGHLLMLQNLVGSNKQPLRALPFPHPKRRKYKRKGR